MANNTGNPKSQYFIFDYYLTSASDYYLKIFNNEGYKYVILLNITLN